MQLLDAVDSPVTLTTTWRRNGILLTSSANRAILDPVLIGDLYLAQVVFSPLRLSSDDGTYACEATVSADGNQFIMDNRQSSTDVSLRASGKDCSGNRLLIISQW